MRFVLFSILAFALCLLNSGVRDPLVWADDSQETSSAQPTTTLVTRLGDRLPGHWLATDELETLAWQVEGFVEPFQFEKEHLSAIQIRHQGKVPQIEGTYRCELTGGDVLYGTPLSINEMELVFELPNSGPLRIERSRLRKLSPWNDTGQAVSSTPTSLREWKGSRFAWQESAGRITAIEDDAELKTSLQLGSKSQTSIRIAWEGLPDFRIDLGSSAKWDLGLRLETWQDQLVLVAESPQDADVLLVRDLTNRADELLLNVFVDTQKQTILVADENGKPLGKLAWQGDFERNFRILARKKGLHFNAATVTPWDGSSPELLNPTESSVRLKEGKTEPTTITAWNPGSQEWTLVAEGETPDSEPTKRQVASSEIESLLFVAETLPDESEEEQNSVQVVSRTGMKLTGDIVSLRDHAVELRCRGIKDPIVLSLASLRGLVFLSNSDSEIAKPAKTPLLQISDVSMVGQLVDGKDQGQGNDLATALVWKPTASKTAAAISHHASGSITYREPPAPIKKKSNAKQVERSTGIVGGLIRLFSHTEKNSQASRIDTGLSSGATLHLRSGDSIPCQPTRIDREGVTFTSSVIEATFAPHEKIKAIVLLGGFEPAQVTKSQRDRLLTLPRIQQEYPPTHLLLSVDGDLLRTRVTAMDDKLITTEIRLNPVNLPRERIAAIAWLHQDELAQAEEGPAAEPADSTFQVQAVQSDGIRLTFRPQEFSDGVLLGKSEVFDNCRVEVSQVDKFLFGQAIQADLKHQSHQLLTLKPAIVPRFVTADNSAPTDLGQGSALVGMDAPPIRLKNLDGSKFDLEELRGKVVVLDFWATWCGPCVQWMPQLEEIVASYPDDVELVTINLLQEKEVIQPALDRMQMSPTVLLDLDGVVADAYQATAIPQTVIIDQEGKIARLFIGGSPQIKQPLIDALEKLTSEPVAN